MVAAFIDRVVYISFVYCGSLSNIRWKTRPLSDIHYITNPSLIENSLEDWWLQQDAASEKLC